jgi:hypothetical protein
VCFDTARTIRVVGEDETTKVKRINDPNDPASIDINQGRYDVVVETGPSYSTRRVEAAEQLQQLVQSVPAIGQVGGDIIVRSMDMPHGDELADRIKKTYPPGIVEEDDEDLSDEQKMAKQQAMQQAQQQQQMQQQAIEIDMADKAAGVDLKRAQAAKTMAEANTAGAPMSDEPRNEFEARMKVAELRKAEADADAAAANADKARAEAERAFVQLESDRISVASGALDLQNKPTEQAMSQAQAEKALKEPPKPAAKPKA